MAAEVTRRQALLGAAALSVAGVGELFLPRSARAAGAPLKRLTAIEATALESLGETLLPGAAEAGIAHFVDHQLDQPEPLLTLRYVDFPMAPAAFYQAGLAALDTLARTGHGAAFAALDTQTRTALVTAIAGGQAPDWQGPPAPLFYFIARSDALDVVYGTEAGFKRLNLPYQAHIAPSQAW